MSWLDALSGLIQSAARPVAENVVGGALGAMRGAAGGPVDTSDYWGALAEQKKNRAAQSDLEALSKLTGKSPVELRTLGSDAFGKVMPTTQGYMRVSPTGVEPVMGPGPIPEAGGPPSQVPLMPPTKAGSQPRPVIPPAGARGMYVNGQWVDIPENDRTPLKPDAQAGVTSRFETRRKDRADREAEARVNALLTEQGKIATNGALTPEQKQQALASIAARLDDAIRDLPAGKRVRAKRLAQAGRRPAIPPSPGSLKTPGGTAFTILP